MPPPGRLAHEFPVRTHEQPASDGASELVLRPIAQRHGACGGAVALLYCEAHPNVDVQLLCLRAIGRDTIAERMRTLRPSAVSRKVVRPISPPFRRKGSGMLRVQGQPPSERVQEILFRAAPVRKRSDFPAGNRSLTVAAQFEETLFRHPLSPSLEKGGRKRTHISELRREIDLTRKWWGETRDSRERVINPMHLACVTNAHRL